MKRLLVFLVVVGSGFGQAVPTVTLTPAKSPLDFSGATSTKPHKTGTTAPATCAVGETFFDTDATAGLNNFACTATNTWTLQGDGAGGVGCIPAGSNDQLLTDTGATTCASEGQWTVTSNVLGAGSSAKLDLKDITAVDGFKVPTVAGYVPTADGTFGFNSTTHLPVFGSNGSTFVVATTSAAQTFTGVQTMTSPALTTPAITGLATGSGVAAAATASTLAARDANANLSVNSILDGYTTTATAAGTTTLTVGSTRLQYFTGSTTQTVALPVATTLVNGQRFHIVNNSTGLVTIQTSGGNTLLILAANTNAFVTCINTAGGTGTASWSANAYEGIVITSGKALTISNSITIAGTDGVVMTTPTTSFTVARTDAANTFTGVQTMTAAALADPVVTGSLAIPQGTGPTVDATGEIAVDTTTGQFKWYDGTAARVLPSIRELSFVITAPAAADDFLLMKAPWGMTILSIHGVMQGGTNVIGQLQECDSAGANCADLDSDITFNGGDDADDGTLTDPTIASAGWIGWRTTSVSGTVNFLTVTVQYRVIAD